MGLAAWQELIDRMMRMLLLFLACVAVRCADVEEKIKRNLDIWNGDVACWGEENALQYHLGLYQAVEECAGLGSKKGFVKPTNPWQALPAGLNRGGNIASFLTNYLGNSRNKRQATGGLIETDDEDTQEFLENFEEYKGDVAAKMRNLTCVMTKLNISDSALQVNLDWYTTGFWDKIDLSKTLAGSDPVWRQMMVSGFTDCFSIAQTWPQESLDRNPISKVFGRHMIFFKCALKVESECCYQAQMYENIQALYGDPANFDWSQYGIPNNKYKRATLFHKIGSKTATDEENFVYDVMFSGEGDL